MVRRPLGGFAIGFAARGAYPRALADKLEVWERGSIAMEAERRAKGKR